MLFNILDNLKLGVTMHLICRKFSNSHCVVLPHPPLHDSLFCYLYLTLDSKNITKTCLKMEQILDYDFNFALNYEVREKSCHGFEFKYQMLFTSLFCKFLNSNLVLKVWILPINRNISSPAKK